MVVPSITTLAPMRGSPVSTAVTLPAIFPPSAMTFASRNRERKNVNTPDLKELLIFTSCDLDDV
jgi:hypothetical protein